MLKRGNSKMLSNFTVFLVSAFAHEFVVSASIGIIEYWAFLGMLA
jgi:diacylglycerol O-acyltransferase-1